MDKINGVQLEEIKDEGTPMVQVIPPSSQHSSSQAEYAVTQVKKRQKKLFAVEIQLI